MDSLYDSIIVGGGPAGLVAAVYLARFGLTPVVLEHGKSRAATIPRSRNFPGYRDGVIGRELVANLRDQLAAYGVKPILAEALSAARAGDSIVVETDAGQFTGRTLFLGTGIEDVRPTFVSDAEHDKALQSFLLHYCPICDGFEATRKPVAAIGTGAHGMREALFLHSYANNVSLFAPNGPHELTGEERTKLRDAGVTLIDGPLSPMRVEGDAIVFEAAGKPYRSQAVYGALGGHPRSELAKQLGAELSPDGCIVTDAHNRTTAKRLYAGGDVIFGLDQITTAIGHAATAATTIRNDLYAWGDRRC